MSPPSEFLQKKTILKLCAKFEVRHFNLSEILASNAMPSFRKKFKCLCPDYSWEHARQIWSP